MKKKSNIHDDVMTFCVKELKPDWVVCEGQDKKYH